MNKLSLKEAIPEVASVAGTTGMSVTDARVTGYINKAIYELMNTGDYPGVVDRWLFRVDAPTGLVALPYTFDRMMQATVDDVPATIVSPWFEFYQYGPGATGDDYDAYGNLRRCWTDVITDRGEMPVQVPIPDIVDSREGPWVLRVYAQVDEDVEGASPVINIQGNDPAGLIIRSLTDGTAGAWYTGLNIPIDFNVPFTETTQEFSKITSVVKPATHGYVKLTAWNGTDEVVLSNYAYDETTPSYRHYYVPKLHNKGFGGVRQRVLLARCRKRYVPALEPDDVLIITNIEALKEMVIAQYKRLTDNGAYLVHRQSAVEIMRAEAQAYLGKSRIPGLTFQRGFPLGSVPFVR